MDSDTSTLLTDAVRLAQVDPVGSTAHLVEVVGAAPRAGVGDVLTVALDAVRDLDEDVSLGQIHRAVAALHDALQLDVVEGSALQEAAVAAQCRRHLAGELSARELTYWVWRVVGLRGSERTRPFMGFEDEYTRYAGYDCTAIDADVTTAAATFLEPPEIKRRRGLFRRR